MRQEEKLTITGLFQESLGQFGNKCALKFKRGDKWQEISFSELEKESLKISAYLLKQGLKKNDFVALLAESRPEWVAIYLGIVSAGLACVPLDIQLNPEEIKNLILDSSAKILFCSNDLFKKKIKQEIKDALKKIIIIGEEFASQEPGELPEIVVQPEDIASLIYTSGTTGLPKGVVLTHKNICSNFLSLRKLKLFFSSDNFLALLPLHHTFPFMATVIAPLLTGSTIVFPPAGFKPEELAKVIKETRVTILTGVPQLYSLIHNSIYEKLKRVPGLLRLILLPLLRLKLRRTFGGQLRLVVSGGARLEPKIARNLTSWGFKLIEGYGLTETSPVVTLNPLTKVKFASVGKAIPQVDVRIDNPDKKGEGEILIKGANVMKGYYKRPDLTDEVIKEGWFHSGDLGFIDKEGYLFITGRVKDVIVLSSGKNIYPQELEKFYSSSPYIKELCILAVEGESFGYSSVSLQAVIVPDFDYFKKKNESNIRPKIHWEIENLSNQLPSYQRIMGFVLAKDELPKTALRKIQKYKVKEQYLQEVEKAPAAEKPAVELGEEEKKILESEAAKKILVYLRQRLKTPVDLNSHLEIDLGIDSLKRVELGLGLEEALSIKIPDELLSQVASVKDIIIKLSGLMQSGAGEISEERMQVKKEWSQILKEPPGEEVLKRIRLQVSLIDWIGSFILKNGIAFIFRIFWLLKIKKNTLPQDGPFLITPNHASYLDGFAVFASLPLKTAVNTYFLGYAEIFEQPFFKWAIKSARLIPIDPGTKLTAAMQAVAFVLSHKKIVCIFPEGRRSIDENIKEFKKGVGILIKELDIISAPVYIKGSHRAWPRGRLLPRFFSPLRVVFGEPQTAKQLLARKKSADSDDYETAARALRDEVLRLR